jgi:predicted transcriptional regulator
MALEEPNNEKHIVLSSDDIDIIVDRVCKKLEAKLYNNIGSGIFSLISKAVVIFLVALAAYGAGVTGIIHK